MADNIKGLRIEFDADTSKFKKQMSNFNKDLRSTENQAKSLAKGLEFEWDEKNFVKAQELARKAIEKTEEKADVLRQRLQHMEESGIKTDKQRVEYSKLQETLTKTESKAAYLGRELERINKLKLDNLVQSVDEVGKKLTKAGQAMAPVSGAAAGVVAGLGAIGASAVSTAKKIDMVARQLNISAEELQRWQYISQQTNVEFDELRDSFITVQAEVGKLARGEIDNATKALSELGFTASDSSASMEDNFEKIVNSLSAIEDPAQRALIATQLFGESAAARITPLLQVGADGVRGLTEEFEALGYMSEEDVQKLREFEKEMTRIKESVSVSKNEIGVALLPVMESLANVIETKIVPAIQKFSDWFSNLSDGSKTAIVAVLGIVTALAPLLLIAGKITSGISGLIPIISKLGTKMGALLGPVGIIIGVLTLLYSTNEKFREAVNNLIGTLMSSLAPILTMLGDLLSQLMIALMPIIDMLGNTLATVIVALMPVITSLLSVLMPILSIIIDLVMLALQPFIMKIQMLSKFVEPLVQLLMMSLAPTLAYLNVIFEALGWVLGHVSEWIGKLTDWVMGLVESFVILITKALEPVTKFLGKIWDFLKRILGLNDKKTVDIDVKYNDPGLNPKVSTTTPLPSEQSLAQQNIQQNAGMLGNSSTVNNTDNSTKNIEVNLTIENYAAELDYDDVVEQINLALAKGF